MRLIFDRTTGELVEVVETDPADVGMLPGTLMPAPSIEELRRWQDEWFAELVRSCAGDVLGPRV